MTDVAKDRRAQLAPEIEGYRSELTAYCYRMLGSPHEAEEAAQDALVRAWRALDRFEGRSALRSWLYKIATNVCYDMLDGRKRRALPVDLVPETTGASEPGAPLPEGTWVEPIPDGRVLPATSDPAEATVARESIRLAFVAALQHLPARQRAVLILREVLRWRATEVADLLETTVASVNSALQRARATLAEHDIAAADPDRLSDDEQRDLLARYVDAFERYDVDALVALLHEDARMSMPPMALWLRGPQSIADWWNGPGLGCKGSRVVHVAANGMPALAQYRPAVSGSGYEPFAIHLVEMRAGRIAEITAYIDTETGHLFELFGLPARLED
jgi:RNA polymerase sigma-70 factor (ECF subfamily)